MLPLDLMIRAELARYLAGEIALPSFERSFGRMTAGLDEDTPQRVQDLVFDVELALAERAAGHRQDSEVRDELLPYVQRYEVTQADTPILVGLNLLLPVRRRAGTPLQGGSLSVEPHRTGRQSSGGLVAELGA